VIEGRYADLAARINAALEVVDAHGHHDGAHHKQWVVDQMLRALLGEGEYRAWRHRYEAPTEDYQGMTPTWDEGRAP